MPLNSSMIRTAVLAVLCTSLVACQSFRFPGVYRVVVPQGNVFDEEMISQLEVGMTRSQVRFIMGTPLIKDTFNPDRWDYTYQVQRGSELSQKKRMSLHFNGDQLVKIDKQALPEEGTASTD